ncbi:MAG TPA: aminopeptidase [Gemmatimonadaceae bacterium]|nr:aminopeptidase [Gemmatimonadaceae bacterium]
MPPAPGPRRRWRRALGVASSLLIVGFLVSPLGCYLSRAGWEEAKILARRRPIAELVADSATDPATRGKLRLVLQARAFARDSVGLRVNQSFTTYSRLDRDTLVLNVSAAYRDQLRRYTWWFPVVGRVPYKGYFDFDDARRLGRELEARGLDVYLWPAAAFSTLGVFNDPLLPTTLREDSLDLASTVIHELTHNTFYARGGAVFNESFAEFVGARGAAWFFRARGDTAAEAEVLARWSDQKVIGRFWEATYQALDSAFKAHPEDRVARLSARDTIFARARRELVFDYGPRLRTVGPRALERFRLDNAILLMRRVYNTELGLFDAVLAREGGDLRRAVARIIAVAKDAPEDPFGALRRWVAGR